MSVKVRLDLGRIQSLSNSIPQAADRIIEGAAREIEGGFKTLAAVDTGANRASAVVTKVGKAHRRIGPTMRYSPFQEMGTRNMAARPALMPAFERVASGLAARLRGIVG